MRMVSFSILESSSSYLLWGFFDGPGRSAERAVHVLCAHLDGVRIGALNEIFLFKTGENLINTPRYCWPVKMQREASLFSLPNSWGFLIFTGAESECGCISRQWCGGRSPPHGRWENCRPGRNVFSRRVWSGCLIIKGNTHICLPAPITCAVPEGLGGTCGSAAWR